MKLIVEVVINQNLNTPTPESGFPPGWKGFVNDAIEITRELETCLAWMEHANSELFTQYIGASGWLNILLEELKDLQRDMEEKEGEKWIPL